MWCTGHPGWPKSGRWFNLPPNQQWSGQRFSQGTRFKWLILNNVKHSDIQAGQGDLDIGDGSTYPQTSNDQAKDSVKVLDLNGWFWTI